jgi:ubiquinone/menaquinone biosynthesis C-methylase UbiE
MPANFNNSAWFYDRLSRMVYGDALIKAQVFLLQFIPAGSKILIVGGGTGWILEKIIHIHPRGLQITYIEVAPAMMALSEKRDAGLNTVIFITAAAEHVALPVDFDVLITPFLFDNFTESTLQIVFNHLDQALKAGGTWLNCDFQLTGKWWQKLLLKAMFMFFRLICGIEASRLPAIQTAFARAGYPPIQQKDFFGGFVRSQVFKKS